MGKPRTMGKTKNDAKIGYESDTRTARASLLNLTLARRAYDFATRRFTPPLGCCSLLWYFAAKTQMFVSRH